MGKSATRAKNKYNKKAYDRVFLRVPAGTKSIWQEIAEGHGCSLNKFIIEAVSNKMKER
ncbi:hypothetical protein [Pectinatus frisingensis]|uniref:hypothetical protein n=1 Tax=Pectinatus frisingensis TaxID=865 RepID=UPI0018C47B14|nr:hypothetical protein [Pectinatus frisingensis]